MRKAISFLVVGNLLSKLLGLCREVFVAGLFGTGAAIGAFRIAQAGTLVPVNFFTSDSLNSAFIPLYKRFYIESKDKANSFLWIVLCLFAVISSIIIAGLWIGADAWVAMLAPGLTPASADLAAKMVMVMSLGVPFYLLTAVLNYLGMAHDDFVPMAARASVQSVGLMLGALVAYLLNKPLYFAWGFTISFAFFSAWALRRSLGKGFIAPPSLSKEISISSVLSAFWRALRPVLLLPVLLQGNIVIERAVASLIGVETISALDYARFITETLTVLVSVPVAFAGLTSWSALSKGEMKFQLAAIFRSMILVTVPASAFLVVNASVVVRALYARGAFNAVSATITADVLTGIALGLWAQAIGYVLLKALSAQLENRLVLVIMGLALASNALVNVLLYRYCGALTLGLGSAAYGLVLLAASLNALKLWREFVSCARSVVIGLVGYLPIAIFAPLPAGLWTQPTAAVAIALSYWGLWIGLQPSLRSVASDILFRRPPNRTVDAPA